MKAYIGTIIEESLRDNRFLNVLEILAVRISNAENLTDRWHLYQVRVSESQLQALANELKPEKWYAHFWDDETIFAVFPGKVFAMKRHDKATWRAAIDYGLALHIPHEQLDFLIDE